jgi:hypothetical protein
MSYGYIESIVRRVTNNFHWALTSGNVKHVKFYLSEIPEIAKSIHNSGSCPVMTTIQESFRHHKAKKLLKLLYKAGADFNYVSTQTVDMPFSMTPLAYCVLETPYFDNYVDDLIKFGAKIDHSSIPEVIHHINCDPERFKDEKRRTSKILKQIHESKDKMTASL